MSHVILLGDSVFDNAAYVSGGADVVTQLRSALPARWRTTLAAVDGAVAADVARQLAAIPEDATHLVISVGGNDALRESGVLAAPSRSLADAVAQLATVRERFGGVYSSMLTGILARGLPTAVCTIYDPRYVDPVQRRLVTTALALINDAIIRLAFAAGVALVDLRLVCNMDDDFANPIEPSVQGGRKIAAAIANMLSEHDFTRRRTETFVR